jgi:hypothetical protein
MSDSIVTYALTNANRRRVLGFAAVNRIPAIMNLASTMAVRVGRSRVVEGNAF